MTVKSIESLVENDTFSIIVRTHDNALIVVLTTAEPDDHTVSLALEQMAWLVERNIKT